MFLREQTTWLDESFVFHPIVVVADLFVCFADDCGGLVDVSGKRLNEVCG